MRLICFSCGKSVSSAVPADTIVRAVLFCPECMPQCVRDDAPMLMDRLRESLDVQPARGDDDGR